MKITGAHDAGVGERRGCFMKGWWHSSSASCSGTHSFLACEDVAADQDRFAPLRSVFAPLTDWLQLHISIESCQPRIVMRRPKARRIVIAAYEGVSLLDLAGPLEAFQVASSFGGAGESRVTYECSVVSIRGGPRKPPMAWSW